MDLDAAASAALGVMPNPSTSASAAPAAATSRPSKFQPKLKGKAIKQEPSTISAPPPLSAINKLDGGSGGEGIISKNETTEPREFVVDATDNQAAVNGADMMEIDGGGEDFVVREIDVLFRPSPIDQHAQLYIMQYPLRPSWRPYELSERCQEVRMKPKQLKLEVDLSLDPHSENYCQDVSGPLRLEKQTLSSSSTPFAAHYAIGLLSGNKLHLNPVNAVVQLRPLMKHLNSSGQQKRKVSARSSEDDTKLIEETATQSSVSSAKQGKLVADSAKGSPDDLEPWVKLDYYDMESHFARGYQQKMVAARDNPVQFSMQPDDYIDMLCGPPADKPKTSGLSLRMSLLPLPLEERLGRWFHERPQVNRFTVLMHLAPEESSEDVLKLLPRYACLVQGLWVSKSSVLYEQQLEILARDFILYQFNLKHVIQKDKLKPFVRLLDKLMPQIAVERPLLNDWKFKEDRDVLFIKQHPDVVKEQEAVWLARYKEVTEGLRNLSRSSHRPDSTKGFRKVEPNKVDPELNKAKVIPSNMTTTVKGALHKAVLELFEESKVLSQSIILMKLREKAAHLVSLPKEDPRAKVAVAVANGASFLQPELDSILRESAVNIHGVYVLKSGKNSEHEALRKVVIKLFQGKQPNGSVRKDEIRQAALLELKRDMKDAEFQQVVNELCDQIARGTWAFKRGTGNKS